jgi:signal transduction histidine kinase
VALDVALDPGLPALRGDEGQLRQALLAILMNALDATPPGGRIRLGTLTDGNGGLVVEVRDTGAGIPSENLDKIFSPFFTTKPVGQGTGLGLAICHGIVTAHGGRIDVDSEVGSGSTFSLVFPRPRADGEA